MPIVNEITPVCGAEPLLASNMIGDTELEGLFESVLNVRESKGGTKKVLRDGEHEWKEYGKLGTGVKSVDEALEGGIEREMLVGIGCESAGGVGVEICLKLLANSLFLNPTSSAALIDTTGNLDILRLYKQLVTRLQSDASLLKAFPVQSSQGEGHAKVEDLAAAVLERVKIMRVFDLVGVMEAVSEVREDLDAVSKATTVLDVEGQEKEKERGVEEAMSTSVPAAPPPRTRKTVIADSEDEDEDEEMLFEADVRDSSFNTAPAQGGQTGRSTAVAENSNAVQEPEKDESSTTRKLSDIQNGKGVTFILIDNLAHVINPLLKKDYVHTHSLASSFLLSLSNLTKTHKLHTILMNPSPPPRPTPPQSNNSITNNDDSPYRPPQQPPQPHTQKYKPQVPPSIFSSNALLPALPNILVPFLDLHILVSRLPRRKADAKALYVVQGGEEKAVWGRGVRGGRGPEMVGVVEILADRWGGRTGGWGVMEL
ncbi:unnamed protein product [Periconia digitata]|uniref:Uncharacterized protein n=1 Tax=Periconia digitata TaxID=1303443 RepID=A0A9W4UE04_9PLEO|nr:unnamed protein product [Periconia digitata]